MSGAPLEIRVGQGFDVHAFVPGRRLVLGGVELAHPQGLLAHSDGDALLHAITDAILGAAGLGDIGRLYPDTDVALAGVDSGFLLRDATARVRAAGWRIGNVDCTVVAQAPKIAPRVEAMKAAIAAALGIGPDAVSIKGKTTEHLGSIGRAEGIATFAVALLIRP